MVRVTVVAVWLLWRRRRVLAGWVFVTMLVSAGVDSGMKALIGRHRPLDTSGVARGRQFVSVRPFVDLGDVVGGWLIAATIVATTSAALHMFTKTVDAQGDGNKVGEPIRS